MKTKKSGGQRGRLTPIHGFLAAAVLGLVVMPIAFAGAASDPGATAAAVTTAKFKKLKKRVAAVEGKTGTAGGDLTGTYPNPQIGPNAVGTNEVALDSLTSVDIAPDAITASELGPDSAGVSEVALDAVGSSELKGSNVVVSAGTDPGAGYAQRTATCSAGRTLIGGGFSWDEDVEADTVFSTPDGLTDPNQWIVRGGATSATNTLFAWAVCLQI